MGFTIKTLDLCDYLSKDFFGSTVISLGNPFISNKVLRESNINISNAKKIINIDRNSRSHYLFKEIYKVEEFNILDISDEEGAQFIHDLNDPINNLALLNKFDFVLDFGTQEHVFNNSTFLLNVFNLLNNRGKYIFVLPGNSDLEHGFRQFSPTFFYDLCYANNQSLSIEWLSLHSKRCNLNMLPLYQKIDKNSYQKISNASQSLNGLASNHGSLTGTSVSLINQLGAQVSVLGIINKRKSFNLNLKVNQCLYRNFSLGEVITENNEKKIIKFKLKNFLRNIFIFLPIKASLKFRLIDLVIKLKNLL